MTENREYLTDAELEELICELEQGDMVQAPPDMKECIMDALEQEERQKQNSIIAYKRYRFRVLTTVAASVALVFLLPKLEGLQHTEVGLFKPAQMQEEVLQREEYATREEALSDIGMLENWLGGVNIFADNSKWNLFR